MVTKVVTLDAKRREEVIAAALCKTEERSGSVDNNHSERITEDGITGEGMVGKKSAQL